MRRACERSSKHRPNELGRGQLERTQSARTAVSLVVLRTVMGVAFVTGAAWDLHRMTPAGEERGTWQSRRDTDELRATGLQAARQRMTTPRGRAGARREALKRWGGAHPGTRQRTGALAGGLSTRGARLGLGEQKKDSHPISGTGLDPNRKMRGGADGGMSSRTPPSLSQHSSRSQGKSEPKTRGRRHEKGTSRAWQTRSSRILREAPPVDISCIVSMMAPPKTGAERRPHETAVDRPLFVETALTQEKGQRQQQRRGRHWLVQRARRQQHGRRRWRGYRRVEARRREQFQQRWQQPRRGQWDQQMRVQRRRRGQRWWRRRAVQWGRAQRRRGRRRRRWRQEV